MSHQKHGDINTSCSATLSDLKAGKAIEVKEIAIVHQSSVALDIFL